ncbi:hypothetical protein B0H13DRAFT_2435875 [Mycena leptocephala]|nr:hypothetical protein B0H13DRAFT_2435875 [Mycena leptocephala]
MSFSLLTPDLCAACSNIDSVIATVKLQSCHAWFTVIADEVEGTIAGLNLALGLTAAAYIAAFSPLLAFMPYYMHPSLLKGVGFYYFWDISGNSHCNVPDLVAMEQLALDRILDITLSTTLNNDNNKLPATKDTNSNLPHPSPPTHNKPGELDKCVDSSTNVNDLSHPKTPLLCPNLLIPTHNKPVELDKHGGTNTPSDPQTLPPCPDPKIAAHDKPATVNKPAQKPKSVVKPVLPSTCILRLLPICAPNDLQASNHHFQAPHNTVKALHQHCARSRQRADLVCTAAFVVPMLHFLPLNTHSEWIATHAEQSPLEAKALPFKAESFMLSTLWLHPDPQAFSEVEYQWLLFANWVMLLPPSEGQVLQTMLNFQMKDPSSLLIQLPSARDPSPELWPGPAQKRGACTAKVLFKPIAWSSFWGTPSLCDKTTLGQHHSLNSQHDLQDVGLHTLQHPNTVCVGKLSNLLSPNGENPPHVLSTLHLPKGHIIFSLPRLPVCPQYTFLSNAILTYLTGASLGMNLPRKRQPTSSPPAFPFLWLRLSDRSRCLTPTPGGGRVIMQKPRWKKKKISISEKRQKKKHALEEKGQTDKERATQIKASTQPKEAESQEGYRGGSTEKQRNIRKKMVPTIFEVGESNGQVPETIRAPVGFLGLELPKLVTVF